MKGVCACEKEMNCNFAYLSLILHLLRCSIAECFDLGLVGMAAFSPLFPSTFAESSTTTERKQKKYQIYSQSKLCDSLEVPFVMLNKTHFIHQKAKKKKKAIWSEQMQAIKKHIRNLMMAKQLRTVEQTNHS